MPLMEHSRDAGSVRIAWKLARRTPDVWRHLTSARHLSEWLGHARSGGFSHGDTLVVDHGEGYLCTSVVEIADDGRGLSMSWAFPDEPPSRLSITVESGVDDQDAKEHCLLRLRHDGLGDLSSSYLPGWITHLTYFEGSLESTPLPPEAFWRLHETHHRLTAET